MLTNTQINKFNDYNPEIQQYKLRHNVSDVEATKHVLIDVINDLRTNLCEVLNQNEIYQRQNSDLLNQIAKAKNENVKLTREMTILKQQPQINKKFQEEVNMVYKKNQELQQQNRQLMDQYQQLYDQLKNQQKTIDGNKGKFEIAKQQHQQDIKQKEELNDQLKRMLQENKQLKNKVDNLKEEKNKLKEENDELIFQKENQHKLTVEETSDLFQSFSVQKAPQNFNKLKFQKIEENIITKEVDIFVPIENVINRQPFVKQIDGIGFEIPFSEQLYTDVLVQEYGPFPDRTGKKFKYIINARYDNEIYRIENGHLWMFIKYKKEKENKVRTFKSPRGNDITLVYCGNGLRSFGNEGLLKANGEIDSLFVQIECE